MFFTVNVAKYARDIFQSDFDRDWFLASDPVFVDQ